MIFLEDYIANEITKAVEALYGASAVKVQTSSTKKDIEGDVTAVMFPLLKLSRKSPEETGEEIGAWLAANLPDVGGYNVIKGFLNVKMSDSYWKKSFREIASDGSFGERPANGKTVMVEFSSPNTNKPLHLGHLRNILLGWSVSRLLEADGYRVIKANLVNDRGIHICKSMVAWIHEANGATPSDAGVKGDHFVGDYYVLFNDIYKRQVSSLVEGGMAEDDARKNAPIMKEAQDMLVRWEQGDADTIALWKTMNSWVYEGFDKTYSDMGVGFDRIYYESQTYLLGKSIVEEGLEKGVFERHADGSVWCDLTSDGLDSKLLLRSDGTSVYMTQDLGTARKRFEEYDLDGLIYVVGNEQNYHFQVLKLIFKKLGYPWADRIYHLSYGMVELPDGKMKSREGTVVDADDLIGRMYNTAMEVSRELGKLDGMDKDEQDRLFGMLGLGALKYFIIKVDPKKTMLFNPKESIDFNGNTGPFIQYTHARIKSILRKAGAAGYVPSASVDAGLLPKEVEIIDRLCRYPQRISEAASAYSPAMIANYCYDLAKEFNQYYHDVPVLREPDASVRDFRLSLIGVIAHVLSKAMGILGITLPERM